MADFVPDPAKYAEMAKPYDDPQDADNSLRAFMEKVRQLRENYRIAEVVVAAQVYTNDAAKGRSSFMILGNLVNGFALSDAMTIELAKTTARGVVRNSISEAAPEESEAVEEKPDATTKKQKKGKRL